MDFVVSKVAMSICALLVVSVLGGVLGNDVLFCKTSELDAILDDFSVIIETAFWAGCEGDTSWKVPFLSDGETVDMVIRNIMFSAQAGEETTIIRPACEVHTWSWDGSALNRTSVEVLDSNAPPISVSSGRTLEIRTRVVAFENQYKIFEFVNISD